MKIIFQNLMKGVEGVVFQKNEWEFRDMSEKRALLQLLAYHDSNSVVEIYFWDFSKRNVLFKHRTQEVHGNKKKKVELKKHKFEYRGVSRLKALFGTSGTLGFHRGVKLQQIPYKRV